MIVFISGADGALGQEMKGILRRERIEHLATDTHELDITDFRKTYELIQGYCPDVILHFAAVSDVDRCEREQESALRVNALSSLGLGIIAHKIGAKLLFTSTNFIFDGKGENPYVEDSQPNPVNTYGRTKMLGEKYIRDTCAQHFIIRTSWLFGCYSKNFISRFLNSKEKPTYIEAVCDRFASFTYTLDLAEALLRVIKSEDYGTFHIVNRNVGSFFDFLLKAKEIMKFKTEIRSIKFEKLNLPAPRPRFSPLASRKFESTFSHKMRSWQDAIADLAGTLPRDS
jgi:dTDP-4-dehydrorhamnose reductase